MNYRQLQRRRLITAMLAAGLLPRQNVFAERKLLPVTPSQTEGPFYPVEIPDDSDNDLLHVDGVKEIAPGQPARVLGLVADRDGTPIDGARVEIWQCDYNGVYRHPRARGKPDPRFQGFGATTTDRSGAYRFETLRPVPYSGRTPHIHFRVDAPGFRRLTTQLYVAEEAKRNARDSLYRRHTDAERALLTSAFRASAAGIVTAEFNIVLG